MRLPLLQISTLWWREITRFRRQRSRVTGALLQPLVFWLLLGGGLNASFRPAGMPGDLSYMQYFYPGVIVLVLLFTAIFATISTIEDRKEGFLQGVLVAPISRGTLVMGQALGATTLALLEGTIFLILAPVAGVPITIAGAVIAIAVMVLIAFALTNIGLLIAWRIESTQGFHVIMNLILIPIWLMSGAFFPATGAPALMQWIMRLDPLTYSMAALRESLYLGGQGGATSIAHLAFEILLSALFCVFTYLAATQVAKRSSVI
jgi:ABC-2 type transport system permease protein